MKNITKALGIAGIVGASFLPLKSEGQDFINCKKYNPIQNNLFYSIMYQPDSIIEYKQHYNSKKGTLIYDKISRNI